MASSSQYYNIGNAGPTPIIVQGQPYKNDAKDNGTKHQQQDPTNLVSPFAKSTHDRPHPQQSGYRDVFWAFLFYVQLFCVFGAAIVYVPAMRSNIEESVNTDENYYEPYEDGNNDNQNNRLYRKTFRRMMMMTILSTTTTTTTAATAANTNHQRYLEQQANDKNADDAVAEDEEEDYYEEAALFLNLTPYLCIALVGTIILIAISLSLMMHHSEGLIRFSMIMNILLLLAGTIESLASGMVETVITNAVITVLLLYFTCSVWNRIPFAAANLSTATTAVYANMGLMFYAFISVVLGFGWLLLWAITFVAVSISNQSCDENGICTNTTNSLILVLMMISFHWTTGVITNVVHVTTAGTVGTFWFVPTEANGCCSKAVRDSYIRSITTSFGSICLGSLIVAIINAIRDFIRSSRNNGDSLIVCCADCLLSCIESLVEYFNKWAYIYVGLYGFSFMEAGSNVMTLFRNRGWTTIILDVIVDNVLRLLSFTVAFVLAGLFFVALYFSSIHEQVENSGEENLMLGFILMVSLIPFIIVFFMANTVFSVIGSAVNTVIVCYADAPNEFQVNHPQLSERMSQAWRQAYPDEFDQ